MTIIDALKRGPFFIRRAAWPANYVWTCNSGTYQLSKEDILANDWEVWEKTK